MFDRWRDRPDSESEINRNSGANLYPRSTDVGDRVQPPNTFTTSHGYAFFDAHGKRQWGQVKLTSEQRATIDSLLLTQRSVASAWADLRSAILNALCTATGRSVYELTKNGLKTTRAVAKEVPDPRIVLDALDALENEDAERLALCSFDVRELKSGELTFSFQPFGGPKKFTPDDIKVRGAIAEKNMRLAVSRISLWKDQNCPKEAKRDRTTVVANQQNR